MKRQRPQSLDKQTKQLAQQLSNKQTKKIKLKSLSSNFSNYKQEQEKTLPRQFFRQQVVDLARQLLGKVFVRQTSKGVIKAVIVQTEAYKAPLDQACHAKNNNKTERTKYFWLDGGHLYIYTIYMPTNICLNVVAGKQGQPQAVLVRAVQIIEGLDIVKSYRNIKSGKVQDLCNGPGKVGTSLGIDKQKMNGIDLLDGQFKIVDAGFKNFSIGISKRINIDYAGEWCDKPWRFFVEGNSFVSKVDPDKPKKQKKQKK